MSHAEKHATRRGSALAFCLVLSVAADKVDKAAALPADFFEEAVASGWSGVVGITFASDGRMFVWERSGKVWIVEDGVKSSTPFLDISDEVGGWRDYGLLGFALHPSFYQTGYVYLLYVVDRHHLLYAGTASYDPNADDYFSATIGRITRYTARSSDGFRSVDLSTRLVLLGETINSGFPILHQSHGVGGLVFGADGTLLASCGDGASYSSTDTGSASETYWEQALIDGIIKPKENIGAYRSQLVDSLNGKVVRLDPATGNGIPSNPFYNALNPRSARSRTWALGLRNPCRITLRPGTGSHDPADGDPGVLYIGDVGWGTWEDLHVVTGPGQNCGWPAFEGMEEHSGYMSRDTANYDAPNPLFGTGGCTQEYFYFRDLIQQDTLDPDPFFPNPCDPSQSVPNSVDVFVHTRPSIDWKHSSTGPARTAIYDGSGNAEVIDVGASGSPVSGPQFGGNCSIGGVWYTGDDFPPEYRNTYFHADYGQEWIRNFVFDANDRPVEVRDFIDGGRDVVAIATHPIDGGLYYVDWSSTVWKVSYVPSGNLPPTAAATVDVSYGTSPLTVQFTGSGSTDPEGLPLLYEWDFGDGSAISNVADPEHTFSVSGGAPTAFNVTLTVTDSESATSQATLLVSVNNTPPSVSITNPSDGTQYPVTSDTVYDLTADIVDAEHGSSELSCEWQTILHHNDHTHDEPIDPSCTTTTTISPLGCGSETYYYRIVLRVTDGAGLVGADEVALFPDCPNVAPVAADDSATVFQGYVVAIDVLANDTDSDGLIDPSTVEVVSPPSSGTAVPDAATGVITYTHDGSTDASDAFTYTARDDEGALSNAATVLIEATNEAPFVTITSPTHDATYQEGDFLRMSADAGDPEDGTALAEHWKIDRIINAQLEPEIFVWDGDTPPDFEVPVHGAGDRVSYVITVTATDRIGATATDVVHVAPAAPPPNQGPLAAVSADPLSGVPPLTVSFDALASSDPEGDYLLFTWDFGDRSLLRELTGPLQGYTYEVEGLYTVTLTVTDAAGAEHTTMIEVEAFSPGLEGVYFDNIDLTAPVFARIDPTVDFDWGSGSPDPSVDSNTFSVRWTGEIEPLYTETYTMYAVTDDGFRLWIDGGLVIDSWIDQAPTEHGGTVAMTAGVRHDIEIEYYENGGGAVARLLWSSPSQSKEVVPSTRLYPPQPNRAPFVSAGSDRNVVVGEVLHLEGYASDDGLPDPPGALTVQWSVVSGPGMPSWPFDDADDLHTHVTFPVAGTYIVRLEADDGELSSFDDLGVMVSDIDPCSPDVTPPAVTCGPSTVFTAVAGCRANVPDFTADIAYSDDCAASADLQVLQTPAAGTQVDVGIHTVTIDVTDPAGNTSSCALEWTVEDRGFMRGNVNNRGAHLLDIGDVIDVVNHLFAGYGFSFDCDAASDVNDDGLHNIVDVVSLVQGVFATYVIPPPGSDGPAVAAVDGGTVPSVLGCDQGEDCP